MKSFGEVLDQNRGLGPGFDFLRIALALAVVIWHVFQMTGYQTTPGPVWVASHSVLIMFFGLSGFLITGSAQRLNLRNFLLNRGLRIFPALVVEVLLSAFVLGPLFTSLPLAEYFTDKKFFFYLTNLFGAAYFLLPGVFNGEWVNGSIWTVPYEIGCYAIMSALIFYKALNRKWLVVWISVAMLLVQAGLAAMGYDGAPMTEGVKQFILALPAKLMAYLFHDRGSRLLVSFTVGIAMYVFRYKIPYSRALLVACLVFVNAVALVGMWTDEISAGSNIVIVIPMLYVTIFLGMTKLPMPAFLHKGDYSYGIYLYGWPLTQLTRHLFPAHARDWTFVLPVSLVFILIFAAASWHLIERPVLQQRKKFSFVARQRLEGEEAAPAPRPVPADAETAPAS